jgi:DNA-binding transcriptional MerR regulator
LAAFATEQLKPVKRRGNGRYHQRQDVLAIRQIRALLYDQGFTIGGARQNMQTDPNETKGSKSATDVEFNNMLALMINELEDIQVVLKS